MPPLVIFAIAALSISLPLLAWSVLARPDRERRQALTNLRRGLPDPVAEPITSSLIPRNPAALVLSRVA